MNEILTWGKEHALFLLLFFATAVCCVWLSMVRRRLKIPMYAVFLIAVLHTLIGVLSVKIFAFLETGFNPDSLGNISLFGGVFFMPLVYWAGAKLTKRDVGLVYDLHGHVCTGQLHCLWMLLRLSYTGNAFSLSHKGTRDPLLYCDADSAHSQSKKEQEPRQYLPDLYGILRSVPLS